MLRLSCVHKAFGGRPVLRGVNLEVPKGGVTFVVGKSGAGKSVLSMCCVGLLRIDSGEVWVGGTRIDSWPERRLTELRRRIPYVVQGSSLLDWMTLEDNVALPLTRALGLPEQEATARARDALAGVGIAELAPRLPPEVGPGVRKQASIARALALAPEAVIYDEPTTGLDAQAARRVSGLIRRAAEDGSTALVVSHDLSSLRQIGDRVAVLDEGKIGFVGTVPEFFEAEKDTGAIRRFLRDSEGS